MFVCEEKLKNWPGKYIIFSMNTFDKIKLTLATGSGKCVVLHNEEPRYIVMTWQEYQNLLDLMEKLKKGEGIDINEIPL